MEENSKNQAGQQEKSHLSWSQPTRTAVQSGGPAPQNNKPPVAQQQKLSQPVKKSGSKTVGIVVAIVVLAGLGVWAFSARHENTAPVVDSMATTTATTTETTAAVAAPSTPVAHVVIGNTSSLNVPSPQDAGLQVAVSNVSVSVPTWVVVYENHNGQPGNALGASLFTSGRPSGAVDLLRGTLPGQTYFVGEAQDDGDHIFSLQNDPAVRDAQGNPVWVQFQTR